MGKDLKISNVAENIVGNITINALNVVVHNARGLSFKEFLYKIKCFTRNTLVLQPPINYVHKKKDKHGDFTLLHNGKSYFIEVKPAEDANSLNEYAVYCQHTKADKNMIVLVGDNPIQFKRNVQEFAKFGIDLLTLEQYKKFIYSLA